MDTVNGKDRLASDGAGRDSSMTSARPNGEARSKLPSENGHPRTFLMSELVGRKVTTTSGAKLGKLKDFVFVDDPKYAEVTHLIVGRPFGDPSLKVPWNQVVELGSKEVSVKEAQGGYPEVGGEEELLLLRDKILDKRILDTSGLAVEVVYDIQLLLVDSKLFIVAADISSGALTRRLGFGSLGDRLPKDAVLEGYIPWKYVQPLGPDLTSTKGDVKLNVAKERLGDIHPEDLADILEELDREERIHVFSVLDSRSAAAALDAAVPQVQRELLAETSADRVVQIFKHLSAVEISEVISILPRDDADEILKTLTGELASRVQELVNQHDVPAAVIGVRRFLQFPEGLLVEEAFDRFRKEAPGALVTMYVYVVDGEGRLKGVVDINELLQASPEDTLGSIMTRSLVSVGPETKRGEVESLFRRYRFRAIPVVDVNGRMVAVVREKDAFSTGDEIRLSR